MSERLALDDVAALARDVLMRAGACAVAADAVARAVRAAERDGIRAHGLMSVLTHAERLRCGTVDGQAQPLRTRPRSGRVHVDAAGGFAQPAIDLGFDGLTGAARTAGIAALTLSGAEDCGVLGHHAERIAEAGMIGLCLAARSGPDAPCDGDRQVALALPGMIGGFAIDRAWGQPATVSILDGLATRLALSFGTAPSFIAVDPAAPAQDALAAQIADLARALPDHDGARQSRCRARTRAEAAGVPVHISLLERIINS